MHSLLEPANHHRVVSAARAVLSHDRWEYGPAVAGDRRRAGVPNRPQSPARPARRDSAESGGGAADDGALPRGLPGPLLNLRPESQRTPWQLRAADGRRALLGAARAAGAV